MKTAVILGALAISLVVCDNTFTTLDDNLNMQIVVDTPELLQNMVDCFLDKAPCGPVTQSYKDNIPAAIAETCGRCNTGQKWLTMLFFSGLRDRLPEEYKKMEQKYDPKGDKLDKLITTLQKELLTKEKQ